MFLSSHTNVGNERHSRDQHFRLSAKTASEAQHFFLPTAMALPHTPELRDLLIGPKPLTSIEKLRFRVTRLRHRWKWLGMSGLTLCINSWPVKPGHNFFKKHTLQTVLLAFESFRKTCSDRFGTDRTCWQKECFRHMRHQFHSNLCASPLADMSPCRNESGWCCQGVLETCLQGTCAYHSLKVHQCQCPVGLKIRWDMNDWIISGYGCLLDFCINSSVFAEACECLCHVVLANAVGNVSCWEVLWPLKLRDRPQSAVCFIHQYLEKRRPILDAFVLRVRSPAALVLGIENVRIRGWFHLKQSVLQT